MPQLPGETLLLTLFADVHYYFNAPSSKPLHDRFDRASYVYLYQNASQAKARVEIANNAGTPDQDAFNGFLGSVLVKHRYQQPNLLSITAEAFPTESASAQSDSSRWRLPTYDLRNEQKLLFKLHTLDIYFWTVIDASRFLDVLKRLLPQQQLKLAEPPRALEHQDSMSPIVEKLENAAIKSPPHVRNQSDASAQAGTVTAPAQPAPAVAPYNPAAPAAPEPIAHREKTPPPPDAESGTGLASVAVHDQGVQFAAAPPLSHHTSYQQTPQQQFFPGPPQHSTSMQSIPPPPPPQSNIANASATYQNAGYAPSVSPGSSLPRSSPSVQTSLSSQPSQQHVQYASYPQQGQAQPQFAGPPNTPSAPPPYGQLTPMQSPGMPQQNPLQLPGYQPGTPGHPVGGYGNYDYSQQPQHPQKQTESYQVHNELYRPTEAEAAHGHHKPANAQPAKPGGFEDRVSKLEKGVGRFLRKLDNKI